MKKQRSGSKAKESLQTTNVYGKKLKFYILDDDASSNWKIYIVEKEVFSVSRWLIYTVILSTLAFYFQLHTTDITILTLILLILCMILLAKSHLTVKQESLLVMASLGLQLTTTFANGRQISQFFHLPSIKDVVLNEGITMQRVLFYLAILLHGEESAPSSERALVPLFQNTLPRLDCLQRIYRGIQSILFKNGQ